MRVPRAGLAAAEDAAEDRTILAEDLSPVSDASPSLVGFVYDEACDHLVL
jgi:hypothetical protein